MRVLVQRVTRATLSIGGETYSHIGRGLLVLVGITEGDADDDVEWLAHKIASLRIFDDSEGVMNLDVQQTAGEVMVVSQFTLYAATRKGNRPSYIRAAGEQTAVPLYEQFKSALSDQLGHGVESGRFGADMQIELVNDGPVTIWIDSKARE